MIASTDRLIASLGEQLIPVRRLAPPAVRIGIWLAVLLGSALAIATQVDIAAVARRLDGAPDLWLAVGGSVLTAIAASIATFLVSLPDRSPRWAWLPAAPLLLWLGASGAGCLRTPIAGLRPASLLQSADACLPFILATSAPLALVLWLLLRRVRTLRPELTTLTGGLAVGAAAASLLWLDHPFDAGLADLLVHAAAIAMVLGLCRGVGAGLLGFASGPQRKPG